MPSSSSPHFQNSPSQDDHILIQAQHHPTNCPLRYSAKNPIQIEGWLAKEGKALRARRLRYVRLNSSVLSSHRTKTSPHSWQLSITHALVEKGIHPREIRLSLPNRIISFYAQSQQQFDQWIIQLRRAASTSTRVDDYYRIGRLIGEGMNGQVRLGQDLLTQDHVAIKMVPRLGRENETQFLAREIEILLSIVHPNIVTTFDVFIRSRRVHFVMEYMQGGELFDFIAENTHFTEVHAAAVMTDLLNALIYLHGRGIAHRDVKLENLLCANDTWPLNVKLADFGFANYAMDSNETIQPVLSSFVGTPYYIAPEMLRGDRHGTQVDVWAAGVVLYILLSGKFPFGGRNESEYYQRVLSKQVYFPTEEWGKVSQSAKELVRGMLCKDPEKRLTAEKCLQHPWLQKAQNAKDLPDVDIFPQDNITPPISPSLQSPNAFRDNRHKRGKWRHLGMLNHSISSPTDNIFSSRLLSEKTSRKDFRNDSSCLRSSRTHMMSDGGNNENADEANVNRRPSLIRRLLSSGKLSLDHYDGRFPSFRFNNDDVNDDPAAPRKTTSLFSRDGRLRRSFHKSGDHRFGDDRMNFANSQSQRLPPKIARERQRQQRQADNSRRASKGGIFSMNKKNSAQFGQQQNSEYHSSPRLHTTSAHPFSSVPVPPGQRGPTAVATTFPFGSNNDDEILSAATDSPRMKRPSDQGTGNRMMHNRKVFYDKGNVRRTISADVSVSDRLRDTNLAEMDLISKMAQANQDPQLLDRTRY